MYLSNVKLYKGSLAGMNMQSLDSIVLSKMHDLSCYVGKSDVYISDL